MSDIKLKELGNLVCSLSIFSKTCKCLVSFSGSNLTHFTLVGSFSFIVYRATSTLHESFMLLGLREHQPNFDLSCVSFAMAPRELIFQGHYSQVIKNFVKVAVKSFNAWEFI